MDEFINTIEGVVLWLFLFGAIFWAWLHWVIRRQKKKSDADLEQPDREAEEQLFGPAPAEQETPEPE